MRNFRFLNSKYRSIRSKCLSGHNHHSRLEAGHCNALLVDKQAGIIKDYQTQRKVELRVNGQLITTHYPDFWITNNDGSEMVHETKGKEMADWVIKKKLFNALFPDIPYVVVK